MPSSSKPVTAVILAAGKGVRMKSRLPKVLHKLMGRPIVSYVIDASQKAKVNRILLVVGHQADLVKSTLGLGYEYVEQTKQLGTGHALMMAAEKLAGFKGDLLVLAGDTPFLTGPILKKLIQRHQNTHAAATLMTAVMDPPPAYGRIVRDDSGHLIRIVEERDATPEEKKIAEVNTSHYCFQAAKVLPLLSELNTQNDQGEYYLTDIIQILAQQDDKVETVTTKDPNVLIGINSRAHLIECHQLYRNQIIRKWIEQGVTFLNPETVYIEPDVKIGQDTTIYPSATLTGKTVIGKGCTIGPEVKLTNAKIGENCVIEFSAIENRKIENNATIGPFAYLTGE
jgi:bifunctional UDP-N-acetylglucosamine pyrophosphorylase/glucosamine-1-phosphate N-acetyltransferase